MKRFSAHITTRYRSRERWLLVMPRFMPASDLERYPYEKSEALPVLHLEVSHKVSAQSYDRRSNERKYGVADSYCQDGVPNASKVSILEAMPVLWFFRF